MKSALNSLTTEDKGNTGKLNSLACINNIFTYTFQKDNLCLQCHLIYFPKH